jgi:hypothetical protein
MCMIHLKSDLILDVHCSNLYLHWRLRYLSNNYIRCFNSFLIHTLQIVSSISIHFEIRLHTMYGTVLYFI